MTEKLERRIKFIRSCLNDDNGISQEAWKDLLDMVYVDYELETSKEWQDLQLQVEATDGRFYLKS